MANEIKVGTVVQLKSGSSPMTVTYVGGDTCTVGWFVPETETLTFRNDIPLEALDIVQIKK